MFGDPKASFQGYYHRAQPVYLVLSQNHSRIGELFIIICITLHRPSWIIHRPFHSLPIRNVESLLQSLRYWSNLRLPAVLACHILQHQRTTRMFINIPETRRLHYIGPRWKANSWNTFFEPREKQKTNLWLENLQGLFEKSQPDSKQPTQILTNKPTPEIESKRTTSEGLGATELGVRGDCMI